MKIEERPDLDDRLRSLLVRKPPPSGFSDRVMRRIGPGTASRWKWWHSMFAAAGLRWAAGAALACILMTAAALKYRAYRQAQTQGEIARAHAILALRIASAKLNLALRQVQEVERGRAPGTARMKSVAPTEHL